MADIAIFHPYLDTRGGGEARCLRTIEALQDAHEITIYCLNDPDIDTLNRQFNTAVDSVEIRSLGLRGDLVYRGGEIIHDLTHQPTRRLQGALTYPYVDRQNHDLVFSTYNEFGFETPSIQHIDFPNFGPQFESEQETPIERLYGLVCNVTHRGKSEQIRNSKLLANSEWSANVVEEVYGVRPQVVHSAVDTSGFTPRPWEDREDGFISVGRADPVKRPLKVLDIFEKIVDRGHDVHLHWLGTVDDTEYGRKVRKRAAEIEEVTLEGNVPFSEVAEMLSTHKYGLHGRVNEHFGIAVAEMSAGGALPFVHDSGGPREIVGGTEQVLYRDVPDAVSKIDDVLSEGNGREIRERLPDAEEEFGLERFRRQIRTAVSEALGSVDEHEQSSLGRSR